MEWSAVFFLGAFHGINPGMGWLFAVALGMQQSSVRGVWQALVDTVHPPPGEPGEWRLVVEGIRRLASYQEPLDPRQYGLTVALSSGHEVQVVELATEGNATATILCRASPEPLRSQILIADLGPR